MAQGSDRIAFLFDVDNTLLDNDAVQADLAAHLQREFGQRSGERYWAIFEQLRSELGYADYLGALQRYRLENLDDPELLKISFFLLDYPFAKRLYPGALAALRHCRSLGLPVILSDGDVVFQPRKVQRAGLWEAVEGRVLIYLHKEQMLARSSSASRPRTTWSSTTSCASSRPSSSLGRRGSRRFSCARATTRSMRASRALSGRGPYARAHRGAREPERAMLP